MSSCSVRILDMESPTLYLFGLSLFHLQTKGVVLYNFTTSVKLNFFHNFGDIFQSLLHRVIHCFCFFLPSLVVMKVCWKRLRNLISREITTKRKLLWECFSFLLLMLFNSLTPLLLLLAMCSLVRCTYFIKTVLIKMCFIPVALHLSHFYTLVHNLTVFVGVHAQHDKLW